MKAFLFGGILCAAALGPVGAAAEEVSLSFRDAEGGSYRMEGRFSVETSTALVWGVLTDYDGIEDFVSSMRRSRVRERRADHILVEQEASAGVLFFSRAMEVLLEVRERPGEAIHFEDISGEDFEFYRGAWRIEPAPGGLVIVRYELQAKHKLQAPDFLAKGAVRRTAGTLLEEVLLEINRRTRIQGDTEGL